MNEVEELEKKVYDLTHRVEKNELRISTNAGNIKQIWMFVKVYVVDTVKKIGSFRFTRRQVTGIFLSFTLWLISIAMRFFDVI